MISLCACGCGQEIIIKSHHAYRGIPKYVRGHSSRGRKVSDSTKKLLSDIQIGKIRYHDSDLIKKYFWDNIIISDISKCWEWIGILNSTGYGGFNFRGNWQQSHRFMWEYFYGDIPKNLEVMHICDNRKCVNPNHLKLGTKTENMQDAKVKGRIAFGERNGMNKFTKDQVLAVKERYSQGCTLKEAGLICGMSEVHVWQIVNGVRWNKL